ncbi:heterogeneous nuclear ribonucleoprotein 1-like [Momordica charantia]|uniref:Heterogeneous nuclear ribonucleoprotein 1-like n=1 Tax=Momordica charantia TaxID=3673 RepID=A0A6J1DNH8_MOMCH|nr:heterogeneous nuclear ribonucleoprotein 1-like [Momordica charantia]XP_022155644.1 heterogeneous nuclear ribonucleoprotein 1-like [Momordica charantia]
MDSDEGKLFIGGIAWDTSEEKLRDYFSQFGDVIQAVIMRDKTTGRPRGFGFVVFSDPSALDQVLQDKHTIDGRQVEAKRALSREEQQTSSRSGSFNSGRSSGGSGYFRTKKIFVGGLPSALTEDGFRQYFENYGQVTDVVIMYDQNTQRPRGFGFITFDNEDSVDRVLYKSFHELNGKLVEVKRALPKDANPGSGGRGGYQNYGASGTNVNNFDGRSDGNRYMQPQSTAGGFPPYSGYSVSSYGYGGPNSGVPYGSYGSYGVGMYGGASAGFGGPAGPFGNPSAVNAGYLSGAPGGMKSTWTNQAPGYGGPGYGASPGFGAAAPWSGSGAGGPPSAPRGQSPSGASGYGNQGYYGGSDGPYGGYGASGGRATSAPNSNVGSGSSGEPHGMSGGGYMGSGYGDTNGNSGYSSGGWRSDASQTPGAYGGGYGGTQSRHG